MFQVFRTFAHRVNLTTRGSQGTIAVSTTAARHVRAIMSLGHRPFQRLTPAQVMPYTPSMYNSWHIVKATITPKPTELTYGACAVGFILRSIKDD